jgi:hypothetical protein
VLGLGGVRRGHVDDDAAAPATTADKPMDHKPTEHDPDVAAIPRASSGDCLWHRGRVDFSSPTVDATRGRLLVRFGARVEPWWARPLRAIADLAARWELVLGEAVGRGNTSLVVRCRRADGRPAVLKFTPDAELGDAEASALRRWESSGRVPLVWGHDAALGALLLEAIPGDLACGAAHGWCAGRRRDAHRSAASQQRTGPS